METVTIIIETDEQSIHRIAHANNPGDVIGREIAVTPTTYRRWSKAMRVFKRAQNEIIDALAGGI